MQITHLGHACVIVDSRDTRVLIDPGTFSEGVGSTENVDAILITHKHFDHFDKDAVIQIMNANPSCKLVVEQSTVEEIPEEINRARVQVVAPEDEFVVGDALKIQAVGGRHAVIHPDVPLIPNIGYFFPSEGLLHPGDEFVELESPVRILALPTSGPWQALEDTVNYLRAVKPEIAFPIHEGVLSKPEIYNNYLNNLKPEATEFVVLDRGVATEI